MVLSSICKDLAHGRVVTLWASLPCTPWCAYHRMNNKNPAYDARLRKARSESLVLLRGFLRIVKDLRGFARRDRLRIAFEWPRHNDGWNLPVVRSLLRLLPYSARPDGCMYGMARQKPWRIATDFPLLVHRLARRCDRSHAHNRSQRIGETALYSTRFADAVARELVLRTARPQGGSPARHARAGALASTRLFPSKTGTLRTTVWVSHHLLHQTWMRLMVPRFVPAWAGSISTLATRQMRRWPGPSVSRVEAMRRLLAH